MKHYLIRATAVIAFAISHLHALGCDCIDPGSVKTEVKAYALVITAKALSKTPVGSAEQKRQLWSEVKFRFLVTRKFKGNITSDTITIITPESESACGVEFEIGKEYIIYASSRAMDQQTRKPYQLPQNEFKTTLCSRTKELNPFEVEEIRKALQ